MPYRLALESKPLDLEVFDSKVHNPNKFFWFGFQSLESKPLDLEVFDSKVHNPNSFGLDSNKYSETIWQLGLAPERKTSEVLAI
jgi:hypothetical protein